MNCEVCIPFKHTDPSGNITPDSEIAKNLYTQILSKKCKQLYDYYQRKYEESPYLFDNMDD